MPNGNQCAERTLRLLCPLLCVPLRSESQQQQKHVFLSLGLRDDGTLWPKDDGVDPSRPTRFPLSEWGEFSEKECLSRLVKEVWSLKFEKENPKNSIDILPPSSLLV
ncbi:hypothetical protein AABB24_034767 [Solanum stoloniferum]|uniref:Uncharacterized protein n=2 Tax=Solanum stoloniferum TaxID=62892 RepID=A0ABD2RH12_9SOLN